MQQVLKCVSAYYRKIFVASECDMNEVSCQQAAESRVGGLFSVDAQGASLVCRGGNGRMALLSASSATEKTVMVSG